MILKVSTARNRPIFMADSTDHVTGKASLSLTITASKDGGAYASISPTVTDLGNGIYNLALTTTHTNTQGALALHITGTGADPTDVIDEVCPDIPGNATVTGGVNVTQWNGSNVATPNVAGVPKVDVVDWLGSAPNALQSGRVDSYLGAVASAVIVAGSFAANALDAVWSTATRLLTAGTNIVLAKGVGVTGFNDLDAAGVRSAVGLASANLDTQLGTLSTNQTTINNNVLATPAAILKTDISTVEATAPTDSLATAIMQATHVSQFNAATGNLEILRSDSVTVHAVRPVTGDATLVPVKAVGKAS